MNSGSDVAIIGTGMVGCCCAALFARQGFSVTLIGDRPAAESQPTSVITINLAVANLLHTLEVWPQIQPHAGRFESMRVWEQNSRGSIAFDAVDIGQPCLGYVVESQAVIAALLEKLQHNYQTRIRFTRLLRFERLPHCVQLELEGESTPLQARLLVGADGANSGVRRQLRIDTTGYAFNQDAITGIVETDQPHRQTAWQCFQPSGPAALLPLVGGDCCLIWSCDRPRAEQLFTLSDDALVEQLRIPFARQPGIRRIRGPRTRFPLVQLHARRYIDRMAALIGDAAHTTHPLAGMGANLGLLDAAALVEVVTCARAANRPFNSRSTLRRYERWRQGSNQLMLGVIAQFKTRFASQHSGGKILRSAGMRLVDRLPPAKAALSRFACGLSGDLPQICRPGSAAPETTGASTIP